MAHGCMTPPRAVSGRSKGAAVVGALGGRVGLWESAHVRVHPTGSVTLFTGAHSHGQGHETTFAQVVAERLGISPEQVEVVHGDTAKSAFAMGTPMASAFFEPQNTPTISSSTANPRSRAARRVRVRTSARSAAAPPAVRAMVETPYRVQSPAATESQNET